MVINVYYHGFRADITAAVAGRQLQEIIHSVYILKDFDQSKCKELMSTLSHTLLCNKGMVTFRKCNMLGVIFFFFFYKQFLSFTCTLILVIGPHSLVCDRCSYLVPKVQFCIWTVGTCPYLYFGSYLKLILFANVILLPDVEEAIAGGQFNDNMLSGLLVYTSSMGKM